MQTTPCNHQHYTKNGFSKNQQRYKCKQCNQTWQSNYTYHAYQQNTNHQIALLTKESCSIRGISRILHLSKTTVIKKIKQIAATLTQPIISKHKVFEVDELRTYIKNKTTLRWIVLAYERESKKVIGINIGSRTNKTLQLLLQTLLNAEAKYIYTDGLPNYNYLIPSTIHSVQQFGTNRIERVNLSLRTHIKRLSRRTICFSKSAAMLLACIKIYFWY